MKTFSRLSLLALLVFGITVMLIGNIAEAQNDAGMGVQVSPARFIYQEGETIEVIFTVESPKGTPVPPDGPVIITFNGAPAPTVTFAGSPLTSGDAVPASGGIVRLYVTLSRPYVCRTPEGAEKWSRKGLLDTLGVEESDLTAEDALRHGVHSTEPCPEDVLQFVTADYKGTVPDSKAIDITNTARFCVYCYVPPTPDTELFSEMEPCPVYMMDTQGRYIDKNGDPILDDDGNPETDLAIIAAQGVLVSDPAVALKVGDLVLQRIQIREVRDLASWQMNVVYNPSILEVVEIVEGDFLEGGHTPNDPNDDVDALFLSSVGTGWIGVTDWQTGNYQKRGDDDDLFKTSVAEGVVTASQTRVPVSGVNLEKDQNGTLMTICYRILEFAEEHPGLHNIQLSDSNQERISYSSFHVDVAVTTHKFPKEDVNRDGFVNILDLVMVASNIGLVPGNLNNPRADVNDDGVYSGGMYSEWATETQVFPGGPTVGDSHSRVDVNNDGIVNVLDVVMVANSPNWGGNATITEERDPNTPSKEIADLAAAPSMLTPATIQAWIDLAQVEHDGSATFDVAIDNLQTLLVARIPSETKLLLNYPNPFNPETWIPYQLAESTEVTVMIHSMNGALVRTIELGHQAAGTYQSKSQAAYWDGRNEFGEQVASGVYFYTLTAGNFSATGKMLVRK